jgi:hypothetical protein
MQQAWRSQITSATRGNIDSPLQLNVAAYAYGLRISQNCRFTHIVAHGGGLPGYGSLMQWLPEYGVGIVAMANVTYASYGGLFVDALNALDKTGALQPRIVQPSPALLAAQKDVSQLITKWDDALANRIAADNLFLDTSADVRKERISGLIARHGKCSTIGDIEPENALRGRWKMTCERGWLNVNITLAPTMPPRVQLLNVQSVMPPNEQMKKKIGAVVGLMSNWDAKSAEAIAARGYEIERMRRLFAAAAGWGTCKMGETIDGDGEQTSSVTLTCERGSIVLRATFDPASGRVAGLSITQGRDQRCAP